MLPLKELFYLHTIGLAIAAILFLLGAIALLPVPPFSLSLLIPSPR